MIVSIKRIWSYVPCQRTPTLDGFTRLLFWIFDYSFWLFDYSVWLFDYRVKYSKFLLVVERWFLLLKIIFVTPNKLFNIANNQMLISIIWLFRTNNSSNSEIFVSIILIIRPRLAFVGSNPIQARLFYRLKVQGGGSLGTPLMISGTIKASPMKLCTVIVLLKTYQNTKRNFQKYDLWRHNDVITKNNDKIRTSVKPDKIYIIRKVMVRAFRKCNFYWNRVTESKVMAI